jgi:cytochrome c5
MAALALGAFLVGSVALAGRPNPNHGKSVYKSTCKLCHGKGTEAKELTPLSKTQAQWQRVFTKGLDDCLKRVETKTGKKLTEADLADMQAFLVVHAADSDQPETCGE